MRRKTKLIYVGRRLSGREVHHCFLDARGKQKFFKGVSSLLIGGTYEAEFFKGVLEIKKRPNLIITEDIKSNPEWDAQDTIAAAFLSRKNAEKKIKKISKPTLKNALEALEPLFKNLDYFSTLAMLDFLYNEISKKNKKG